MSSPTPLSTAAPLATRLRLVRASPATPARSQHRAAAQVARQNARSAGPGDDDVRAIFAARVGARLQGGRAAVLTPERRAELMTSARQLGLRRFDASLVIAIAQDAARRGQPAQRHPTLALVGLPAPRGSRRPETEAGALLRRLLISALVAVPVFAGLVWWITG
ncbi:MAG TPA: hypothetical protein VD963_05295 [Phycisphaerales bacterium]|nr:hypothetical protein [Phycisphaerales bacterium]